MRVGLGGSGNVTAAQLYAPYGGLRYSSGAMPTAKGFTGQRADALSGLDYYGARSYDAVAGQFTSADTVASGLSPYAYVKGNPETLTDPSGHMYTRPNGGGGDPSGSGSSGSGDHGSGRCNPTDPANCDHPGSTPPTSCTPAGGAKACLGTSVPDDKCGRACLYDYYEHLRAGNHLGADIFTLLVDFGVAAIDFATQSWISFATDLLTIVVQGAQVYRDWRIFGGASATSLIGLTNFLGFMQAAVAAVNTALALGWGIVFLLNPGSFLGQGFKEGVKLMTGTLGSAAQALGAWNGLTDDYFDSEEAQLSNDSPQQMQQTCINLRLPNC